MQEQDGDYFGSTVNRAARLIAVAAGGQVLVSGPARDQAADGLDAGLSMVELGSVRLRDIERPVRVFQVVGPGLDATLG